MEDKVADITDLDSAERKHQRVSHELQELVHQQVHTSKRIAGLRVELMKLEHAIDCVAHSEVGPVVTDHAVLRYMERVSGIDIEKVRGRLAPSEVARAAAVTGDGEYPVQPINGEPRFSVRVSNGLVVTVLT